MTTDQIMRVVFWNLNHKGVIRSPIRKEFRQTSEPSKLLRMTKAINKNLIVFIILSYWSVHSLDAQELRFKDHSKLSKIISDFRQGEKDFVPFVFIMGSMSEANVVIGLITSEYKLLNPLASGYFLLDDGTPVLVYTGLELMIDFPESHKNELIRVTKQYRIEGLNIHYDPWYLKIEDGLFGDVKKKVPKRVYKALIKNWFLSL